MFMSRIFAFCYIYEEGRASGQYVHNLLWYRVGQSFVVDGDGEDMDVDVDDVDVAVEDKDVDGDDKSLYIRERHRGGIAPGFRVVHSNCITIDNRYTMYIHLIIFLKEIPLSSAALRSS